MNRILLVEDENWVAMELAWLVEDAGYTVLGPERSVAEARKALGRVKVDLALLDVSLGSETVFPVSKVLEDMRIPFIFVTGNPALLPAEYSRHPLVSKPWQRGALLALIPQVIRDHSAG
jgi:DNA-binding response OmpR family regulator